MYKIIIPFILITVFTGCSGFIAAGFDFDTAQIKEEVPVKRLQERKNSSIRK